MFYHYNDHRFQKIIDEFILSSNDDKHLSYTIRSIDYHAAKLGISFYHMMFNLIQKDSCENKRKKKWLSKDKINNMFDKRKM